MEQHGLTAHSHGFVPIQTRSERPKSTSVSDFEPISNRQEIWRYLPIERLNGLDQDVMQGLGEDSVSLELPAGWSASWAQTKDAVVGVAGQPEDRVTAAAWTNADQTLTLTASGEIESPAFVRVNHDGGAAALHLVIQSSTHSKATVVLEHTGAGALAEVVEVVTGDESNLNLVSIQDLAATATLVSAQFMKPGRNAILQHTVVSLGGRLIRVTPSVALVNPGAEANLLGAYLAESGNYFEHRPYVDHTAERCVSNVTYKGALQGAGAHTVWVGDVLIRETAVGTNTYELNRNLLLTDGTRADSVPNLEIETGKIEGAGHASASGRFDDEQLFYLRARGLDAETAKKLVVRGFLNEVIQKIGVASAEERLMNAIDTQLGRQGA